MRGSVTAKPLQLTVDREADYLLAIEFGEICDGKPESEYLVITEDVAWGSFREAEGELIGFVVDDLDGFEPESIDELWNGPRFNVPRCRPSRGPRR